MADDPATLGLDDRVNNHDAAESRNLAAVRAAFDAWHDGTGGPWELLNDDTTWEVVGTSVRSTSTATR